MRQYIDLILEALRPDARSLLEAVMLQDWAPKSDFLRRLDAEAEERGQLAGIEKGIEEGIEEGIETGVELGQRALLPRQLRRRFGPVAPGVEARVNAGHTADLERWGDRLVAGLPLHAILADAPPAAD